MSVNSKSNNNPDTEVTVQNQMADPLEILRNQIEFLIQTDDAEDSAKGFRRTAFNDVLDLIDGIEEDVRLKPLPGIEDQYQTVQRDLFLRWDQLEQSKAEFNQKAEQAKEDHPEVKEVFENEQEKVTEQIEEYQDELETAQRVLEQEEEAHAMDNR